MKKTFLKIAPIFLVCAVIGLGGYWLVGKFGRSSVADPGNQNVVKTQVTEATPTKYEQPSPTPLVLDSSQIIVRINDDFISTSHFQRRIYFERFNLVQTYSLYTMYLSSIQDPNLQQQIIGLLQTIENDLSPENLGQRVVNQMIDESFILEEAARRSITISDEEVQIFFDEYFNHDENSKASFFDHLKEYDIDEEFFRNLIYIQLIRDKLNEALGADIPVPEEENVWARHILVEEESAAQDLLDQILSGKAAFEALAREFSIDPGRSNGGDLGWFPRGKMVQPFEEAAFSAEVGEIVGPIQTLFGYHIIEILGKEFRTNQAAYDQLIASALKNLLTRQKDSSRIEFAPKWQEMIPDQPTVTSPTWITPPPSSGEN